MTVYIASGHVGTASALDHPRFCFHKWPATYTATSTAAGADVDWLADGETWSEWKAGANSVTVTLTFGEARAVNYIGIAAHNLDLIGAEVSVQIDTGAGFVTQPGLGGIDVGDDSALLFLLGPVDAVAVRVVIAADAPPQMAVMQAGLSMELPQRATYTALPISESEQTRYRHAQAVKGGVIGRSVEAAELAFSVDIANLSEEYRAAPGLTSWRAFTSHVRDVGPFFVASRPIRYPDDVAYGQAVERPRFNRAIPNHRIAGQFSLNFKGYKRP